MFQAALVGRIESSHYIPVRAVGAELGLSRIRQAAKITRRAIYRLEMAAVRARHLTEARISKAD